MSITYTPTTNFGSKDSLPSNDPNKVIKGAEFTTEFTAIQSAFGLAAPSSNPTFTGTATFDSVTANAVSLGSVTTSDLTVNGAFTSKGIDDNATSTAITIDSNEYVGLGITPSFPLDVSGSNTTIFRATNSAATGTFRLFHEGSLVSLGSVGGSNNELAFRTGGSTGTERMRIDATGNVGIGATSPAQKLVVYSAANTQVNVTSGDSSRSILNLGTAANPNSGRIAYNNATQDLQFSTNNGGYSLTIDKFGDMGVGTETPSNPGNYGQTVDVSSGDSASITLSRTSGNASQLEMGTYSGNNVINSIGSGVPLRFFVDGAERVRFASSGNVGINVQSPSEVLHARAANPDILVNDTIESYGSINAGIILTGSTGGAPRTDTQWRMANKGTDLTFSYAGSASPSMLVDNAGNVGIGEAPASDNILQATKLGQDTIAQLRCSGAQSKNAVLELLATSSNGAQGYAAIKGIGTGGATGQLTFHTGNSTLPEVMRIDSAGNVGVGELVPDRKLVVKGSQSIIGRLESTGAIGSQLAFSDSKSTNTTDQRFGGDGDDLIALTAGAERMRIDSSGNVGIGMGTAAPLSRLQVRDSDSVVKSSDINSYLNNSRLTVSNSSGTHGTSAGITLQSQAGSNNYWFMDAVGASGYSSPLTFSHRTASGVATEAMRIDGEGNLLVGTTAPIGAGASGVTVADISNAIGQVSIAKTYSGTTSAMKLYYGSTQVGRIDYSDTSTDYVTSSDERLKKNVVDAPAGNIDSIKVRSFDWKIDGEHQEYGFIAQELETVAPYAVSKGETDEDMWGVDYSKLVPMLVKEIQDLKAEVEALKNA